MTEAAQDEAFADDIIVPAADGYPLAATLFLPRRAKRHAVLINAATAAPRKIYRRFAGYLARRGCTVTVSTPNHAGCHRELGGRGVICDFRPDPEGGIRLGPHFFNTEDEVRHAVSAAVH